MAYRRETPVTVTRLLAIEAAARIAQNPAAGPTVAAELIANLEMSNALDTCLPHAIVGLLDVILGLLDMVPVAASARGRPDAARRLAVIAARHADDLIDAAIAGAAHTPTPAT
jgi:hypothetical protein